MSPHTTGLVVIEALAALCFLLGLVIPLRHPASAYRLNIVSAGLLLWVVAVILKTAGVL